VIRGILGDVTLAAVSRRPLRGLVVAAVAGLLVVAGASGAQAHDVLESTDPADGSTVATAPDHVTLTFGEPAQALGTEIQVVGPQGEALSVGLPVLTGSVVTQEVAPVRPAGTYTVNWRVTSADGHPVSGTFTFTATDSVGLPAGVTPTPVPTETPTAAPTTKAVDPAAWGHGDNKVHAPLVGLLLLLAAAGVGLATWLVTRRTGS
jgi:methionine-rich copper-binding protein CopC